MNPDQTQSETRTDFECEPGVRLRLILNASLIRFKVRLRLTLMVSLINPNQHIMPNNSPQLMKTSRATCLT